MAVVAALRSPRCRRAAGRQHSHPQHLLRLSAFIGVHLRPSVFICVHLWL